MEGTRVPGVFYRNQWDGSYRRHGRAQSAHGVPLEREERGRRRRNRPPKRRPASGSTSRSSSAGVWNPPRFSDLG
jgi:hypothetical protein